MNNGSYGKLSSEKPARKTIQACADLRAVFDGEV